MKKILVICGPTASGKTSLAMRLARKYNAELISADSRQVYKGLDIGTGKDLSSDSRFTPYRPDLGGFYKINGIKIWGYDLVKSDESFSVGNYIKISRKIINDIWKRGKLPIIVGGTGLYIKGVINGIGTASIPRNEKLRKRLDGKSASNLFDTLNNLDPAKAKKMNSSDSKNPRRLIRAIEVAKYKAKNVNYEEIKPIKANVLVVGIRLSDDELKVRIKDRVNSRMRQGLIGEINSLLANGIKWSDQSMTSLGYRQWQLYFEGKLDKASVVDQWTSDEIKYANKQMVWFKKQDEIRWFDMTKDGDYREEIEKAINKWHNKKNKCQKSL